MRLGQILSWASAIAAGVAAILWFLSARVKIPSTFPIEVISVHTMAEQIIGAEVISAGSSPEIDQMAASLIWQSKLSGYAAIAAGLAAALQALATAFGAP